MTEALTTRGRGYVRPLSPIERTWLVADQLLPPFAIALVVEGSGPLDPERWDKAVARASDACPGSRVVLRGMLGGCRWVDTGRPPPVLEIDASGWDGMSPDGAPFLKRPLSATDGPTTEVLLAEGPTPRVIFRTHHSVMDGRGLMTFVDDVFRCLRGEAPLGAPDRRTDLEIARDVDAPPPESRREDCVSPAGAPDGVPRGAVWRRASLAGRFSRLVPQVVAAVASAGFEQGEGRVRIDVPVDLRAHADDIRSTANLTGMVHLELGPGCTPATIDTQLKKHLAAHRDASWVLSLAPLRWIPLGLMGWVASRSIPKVVAGQRYISSGVVSNLGRMPIRTYRGPRFTGRTAFIVAPAGDTVPFLLTMCGREDGVELSMTMPEIFATDGRLEALLERITSRVR